MIRPTRPIQGNHHGALLDRSYHTVTSTQIHQPPLNPSMPLWIMYWRRTGLRALHSGRYERKQPGRLSTSTKKNSPPTPPEIPRGNRESHSPHNCRNIISKSVGKRKNEHSYTARQHCCLLCCWTKQNDVGPFSRCGQTTTMRHRYHASHSYLNKLNNY